MYRSIKNRLVYPYSVRFLLLLVFTIFYVFSLQSQTIQVSGKVLDAETNDPLIGANVFTSGEGTSTYWDGTFSIAMEMSDSITVTYVSYDARVLSYEEISSLGNEVVIYLTPSNNILETATVTGSKYEQRLSESTVSIDVIKPRLINNINTVEVDEVLQKVPGVQMIDGQANIRGGSGYSYGAGSRVMLLLDDIPALQSDAGFPNWGDIPVENIGQIEVVKGASSALYGSAALNGIIHIRRKKVGPKPETDFALAYTTFADPEDLNKKWWDGDYSPYSLNVSVVHRRRVDKVDLSGSLFYNKLESFNAETYQDKKRFTLNANVRQSDRLVYGVNTMYNHSDASNYFVWANAEDGAMTPYPGNVSLRNNTRYMIDPYITYYGKRGSRHKIQGRYFNVANDNALDQSNYSQMYYAEYQYQRKLDWYNTSITGGVLGATTDTEAELFGDTLFTNQNAAAYLQLDSKVTDKLSISLGSRYEFNRHKSPEDFMGDFIEGGVVSDAEMIFRFGANWALHDYASIRASWGQGYRFPTITERFITTSFGGFGIFPNVNLGPESGWTAELGVKQGVKLLGYEGFFDVSGFWSEYDDMMEFTVAVRDGRVGFQSQNVGNTIIKGMEIATYGRAFISDWPINIYGGYTYIDPRYKEFTSLLMIGSSSDENILKYRTQHNFKLDIEAELGDFLIGGAIQTASHMVAIDNALGSLPGAGIFEYRDANTSGYKIFDVRLAYHWQRLKTSVLINNIMNTEYTLRPALIEAPRNYSVRFDYSI